ncbi:hypothetical protein COCMIDRAFT_40596 [Bipolaris oryzae ATCC 44560]|uniref:O-methyltransferase domain-containing protein n=1 Tax=Bipolaris oryzae ATCC 44560 TaxID=930090 RepID=W6YUJ0_COCMI|nr:uncharacterized protein COCMIDRAFT_40596 [Bipolaris oryzae ATCC 44560]EUC41193.1 hypothetical protein COCMIDRAFT_40596 [Bipolaris oryzae ATCC 44560]
MNQEGATFVHHLARQAQLLSCLHWLSTFQVLACIPLTQSVPIQDVADLAGVPVSHLLRVVRATATVGFLHEPEPEFVAHTPLSSQFVTKPSLIDAVLFICHTAMPTGLQMAEATRLQVHSTDSSPCAYALASRSVKGRGSENGQQPNLHRQLMAYQRLSNRALDDCVTQLLSSLDWSHLDGATVVQVGPPSTAAARALSGANANVRFIVQMYDRPKAAIETANLESGNVVVQQRMRGAPQLVEDASVYIIHSPHLSVHHTTDDLRTQFIIEIKAHLRLLKNRPNAQLILVAQVIPEPGTADAEVEAASRFYDLSLLQMANDQALGFEQLVDMVNDIRDNTGRLVVTNKLCSRDHSVAALQVKIASFEDDQGN